MTAAAVVRRIGCAVRQRRLGQGMTVRAFAVAVGISPGMVCMVETGKRLISLSMLLRLALALETDAYSLMREGTTTPPDPPIVAPRAS